VRKNKSEWKNQLTPLEYDVTRRAATEFAFSGALYDQHAPGALPRIDCGNALFDSSAKFDSGTGWPSFWEAIAGENVREKKDFSAGVLRTEVKCTLCDAHLGHVFTDGPRNPPDSVTAQFRQVAVPAQATSAVEKFRSPCLEGRGKAPTLVPPVVLYCFTSASKSRNR